jgi:hypothetical protein
VRKKQAGAVVGGRREKGRGRCLCSREDIAAVSSEGRVKRQQDVLWWVEMGKQVVCASSVYLSRSDKSLLWP